MPPDPSPHRPRGGERAQASAPGLDPGSITTVLCDLDGVVWLAGVALPGAVDAIDRIRGSGRRVLFVTNNSRPTVAEHVAALGAVGILATGDVVSSSTAAATLLPSGATVLVTGGPGVVEAVEAAGARAVLNDGDPALLEGRYDAVLAGLHRDFDFARLRVATRAIRAGARLIATNTDATYPTPDGLDPGGGAIVAAIATAAGVEATVAGKPHDPMAEAIRAHLAGSGGPDPTSPGPSSPGPSSLDPSSLDPMSLDPTSLVMVGDRPETDGRFAQTLGAPYAQVRTGVLPPGAATPPDIDVALDVDDLAALADALTDPTPGRR